MKSTLFAVSLLQFSLMLQFSNAGQCKFTNAVCKSHNESWVTVDRCRLRAINRNKTILNLQVTLLHTTKTVHAESQIFFKANGYKPWLYKPSIDICRFLKKPYHPVAVMVFNLLKNYTNFNTRCPLLGSYYIDGFYIRYDSVPVAWPSGEYLVKVNWLFDKRLQFSTDLYFMVTE